MKEDACVHVCVFARLTRAQTWASRFRKPGVVGSLRSAVNSRSIDIVATTRTASQMYQNKLMKD